MRPLALALLAVTALSGCVFAQPSPTPTNGCAETPTRSKVVAGQTLWGKGGDVFLVVYGAGTAQDRVLRASTPEKMLVVLQHPIMPTTDAERIPNELTVPGRNRSTGTARTFVVGRHNSELGIGVEWGTNFEFPDAGCWELQLSAPKNVASTVVVTVVKP
jgi:hypothetical protein